MTLDSGNLGQPGIELGNADRTELFLKVFGGEVMDAYLTNTVAKSRTLVRRIQNGKSAQFPLIAEHTAVFHTPGESLIENSNYDGQVDHRERVVIVDQLLVSHSFVDELEEMMNHYDIRAPYARQFGNAIARQHDELVFASVASAVREKATTYQSSGGFDKVPVSGDLQTATSAIATLTVANLLTAIRDLAIGFDKNNVPKAGRTLILRPEEYYLLLTDTSIMSRDYTTRNYDGLATGVINDVYGFEVVMSNVWGDDVANTNYTAPTAGAGRSVANTGDFSGMFGIAFCTEAVGTVMLRDLQVESEYLVERQGNLLVAKQAFGADVIRSECCGALVANDFTFAS
jgi:hypothetical protein